MKTLKLKFALMALVAIGMLSISSCEKEENNSNRLTLGEVGSVWQCSTEHYTITWTLLNDSTIYSEVEKDSGYYAGFGDNVWYNYLIGDATDFGWGPTNCLMFFITGERNSNNETYVIEDPYSLNITKESFTIDYAGIVLGKSEYYYSFKKIK